MSTDDESTASSGSVSNSDSSTAPVSAERAAEIEEVIRGVTRWAGRRDDVVGVLLVGSCARDDAGPESDVDIVLLSHDTGRYAGTDWADDLELGDAAGTREWGRITEHRFVTSSGLEVDLGVGPLEWADISPIDPGTRQVVNDGARVLHDPTGILAMLLRLCHTDGK
jgi:predicted nucleotidyltransferase